MTDNMKIWDAVSTTNPDNTKEVTFGRQFTAIDAHSQVMQATKQFGPIGIGWGFDTEISYPPNDTVAVKVTMWHSRRDNTFTHTGGCDLFLRKGGEIKGPDSDALKKATTDAMTKCMSLLGFNADVFMGKFDDNQYVAALHEANKFKWTGPLNHDELKDAAKAIGPELKALKLGGTEETLSAYLKTDTYNSVMNQLEVDAPQYFERITDLVKVTKEAIGARDDFPVDVE